MDFSDWKLANMLFGVFLLFVGVARGLHLNQGAYEDLVVTISDAVPSDDCQTLLTNLKSSLTDSSQYLFNALDSRAYIRTVQIILPGSWPDNCAQGPLGPSSGDASDITIVDKGPTNAAHYTQQSAGCGRPGDQIYLTHELVRNGDQSLGRILVKEFAKYRYGVFDEHGYDQDQVYPMCYKEGEDEPFRVTSCSDMPVHDNGICTNTRMPFNVSDLVEDTARSSIMFAAEAPSVKLFCDEGIHDRSAPTKHNFMCDRRSTLDVIIQNPDFFGVTLQDSKGITNTTPTFVVKKQTLTRYIMIIEDTKEMLVRESWTYLRTAVKKFVVHDLPSNTEVGLVMANETKATKIIDITSLNSLRDRDLVASNIPYTPGETRAAACLQCAVQDSIQLLKERARTHGPANSVIIIIAPGMEYSQQMTELTNEAKSAKIKIATINYPGIYRQQMLDSVAIETNGVAHTVHEKRHNVDTSLLTTYFQLTNVMYSIMQKFYQGNPLDLPIEIHRRELYDDGRNSVTGSFVLDSDLGEPARFALFTHNADSPLIKSLTLWSPSQQEYQAKSDYLLSVKIITIAANINETGTWTYKIERFSGNPQPHFIQVMATPRTVQSSVVRTKFWTGYNQLGGPLVLYVEVKKQQQPVMGAKVEVVVSRPENGTGIHKERFDLLDTGCGDPDITKGDGIYTRYFNAASSGGAGLYTFEVTVTDNGNAYSVPDNTDQETNNCCGSYVQKNKVQQLTAFQRVLTPITKYISPEEILSSSQLNVGRIGDLRGQVHQQQIKLLFTAPDMGGLNVQRYEVKYAETVVDITKMNEIRAKTWEFKPFPQSAGSETTFTMNITQEPDLLDKTLYIALKAYNGREQQGTLSNWVRVFVPSPLPLTTPSPIYPDTVAWPTNDFKNVVINVKPRTANGLDMGLQLILPIVFGVILLAIIIVAYCYCCMMRRKRSDNSKSDKISTVTIVPPVHNSPSITSSPQHNNAYTSDLPDPHTIGVPVYQEQPYEHEDEKKRLSIVHQQEQQLIEELKHQQQQQRVLEPQYNGNLSVISNNTLQRNGRTLSPYESWTASQLLHEHERRHSPSMMDEFPDHQHMHPDHISITGQSLDHVSVNGNRLGVPEHYPPPVPPLPAYNGYPVGYNIYGVHQPSPHAVQPVYQPIRTDNVAFNSSLQGSMSSVNSGEKKRRNVTMV